jgi:hypothetical protein
MSEEGRYPDHLSYNQALDEWEVKLRPVPRDLTKTPSKAFVIDHPVDRDRYLVHGCLEGPESGVYYRGESVLSNGKVRIELPAYVPYLASHFTVHLTQISTGEDTFARLKAGRVVAGGFTVYGDPCEFAWHVFGTRQPLQTEPMRNQVDVLGHGPYRYVL